MIDQLPVLIEGDPADAPEGLGADHPMRQATRDIAFVPGAWNAELRAVVTQLFDGLAADWDTRDVPGREAPLVDALDRGVAAAPRPSNPRRVAIDIGGGTGLASRHLAGSFPVLALVDLSGEMLRNAAPAPALRVQGDASVLPVADASVDVLVLQNAFLFTDEVDRVLAPDGLVVWVNSRGVETPIHLLADEVDEALPGAWCGVASQAGWGTWSVHWREERTDSPDWGHGIP